ncbi:MAG: hypothetical protein ACLUZQ_08050 [Butyricicoccus sp.]
MPRAVEQAVRHDVRRGRLPRRLRQPVEQSWCTCQNDSGAVRWAGGASRFTLNATHALNIAINALVKPDSRVIVMVTSTMRSCGTDGSKYRADRAGYAAVGQRGYGFCLKQAWNTVPT